MPENYVGFAQKTGFGSRPAVVVIDFIKGFTDDACQLGSDFKQEIEATLQVLAAARKQKIPVIFTAVAYDPSFQEATHFIAKVPALKLLVNGSPWTELDTRLQRQAKELLITKKFASAFFGTHLHSVLTAKQIDTVILAGCTTSGCVRATAVDALQYGFRVVVPEQCVGDRSLEQHKANLFDIQNKYGDVVSADLVIHYFNNLKEEIQDVQSSY